MTIPKRKIEEVIVRLKKESNIREIYVEGLFDRDLFRWIVEKLELNDIRIYPISTVEVPSELLTVCGLTSGERQRVQAMASVLAAHPDLHDRVLFIVDADLDHLLDRAKYPRPLIGTAAASAEVILWRKDIFTKFFSLILAVKEPEKTTDALMSFVEPIVINFALLRATKAVLGVDWRLIAIEDAIHKENPFSFDEYCGKVADKNAARRAMSDDVPPILRKISIHAATLSTAKKIHGHDLFAAAARKLQIDGYQQGCLRNPEELARVLIASMEWRHVANDETVMQIKSAFMPRVTLAPN